MARWQMDSDPTKLNDFGVLLTKGADYLFEIETVEDGEAASGRDKAMLSLKVVDGPDNIGNKAKGRFNLNRIEPEDPGHGMLLQFLHAVGWPWEEGIDFDTQALVGEQFAAHVKHRTYENDKGEDVTINDYDPYTVEEAKEETPPAEDPDKAAAQEAYANGNEEKDPPPPPPKAAARKPAAKKKATAKKRKL